ncbi:hypothetical protein PSEUBRA_006199 [Kalmanozyma brasiliensis GHG001]|uniref:Uncharacterized protein n=1 Tax=Kalmanozyma brasiliensis (strain GHG001) TaxID=1365824 RepID=V5E3W6_KALBG|nr:uncharacterized protein PSEUBRA_006199 [Kalmanozyma brasiliensis GHG001]EST04876.1 hypothetical protein PSEUBRA_006199 [Kalmanozyma brasiliensis GHG001]
MVSNKAAVLALTLLLAALQPTSAQLGPDGSLTALPTGLPLYQRDGSTITVSTTQFNPALTNQGGTTNSAGTFNVSPLATSTSYEFETVQQTSTFAVGSVNTARATGGSGSGSGSGGSGSGSGGSGGGSSANFGGTIVVTATAPTSTVANTQGASGGSSVQTGSNGLPSLALSNSESNAAPRMVGGEKAVVAALGAMVLTTVFGALVVV